ncbi:MAG: bifunctional oligoribonuclease/PAP phosphatase NrnA [Actinomycetota bacterium]|nr:bifunctional oligoribonuclease/PAP phosphatase NrnA [Actinomycetota bacterium]
MRWNVDDWDATVETLRSAKEATLACHVNPDGDALGSLLATHLGLKKMGVGSTPTWGTSPAKIPFAYTWIPGAQDIVQPEDAPASEVFIALDCGAADRLGVLGGPARASKRLINVDHHPGNENFGHLNVVVPDASSTAELVAGLLQDAGVEFDRDIATCLYAGIVTDTGRFQYSNSTPATLRLAADLLEYDVPAPAIAQEVFESSPFAYLKLVGHVLERAVLHPDASFVYSWFTRSDLEESGVDMDETEKLIDLVRSTRDADVAAMFKEQPDGRWRVSMRSKSGVSVGALARARGGGGHELAAGFTAPDLEATVASLLAELRGAA